MRKKPPPHPSAGSDAPPPPPSSGLSPKCRCLICTLQTGGGHREENPHCQVWPPPTQQGPAPPRAPNTSQDPQLHRPGAVLSLPRLYYFLFLVSFSCKRKSASGEAGQSLPWSSGLGAVPFPGRKGMEENRLVACLRWPRTVRHSYDATLQPHVLPFFFSLSP